VALRLAQFGVGLRGSVYVAALVVILILSVSSGAAAHGRSSNPVFTGLTPAQLHAAYQLPAVTGSSASQTIALIEIGGDPTLESDLAVYDRRYDLPSCTRVDGCLRVVNQEGSATELPANALRSGETSIDVQEAHAICQNCRILVVEGSPQSGDLIEEIGVGVNTAVSDGATEISICIELYADSTESAESAYLVEANNEYFNHPGVVITVASGDCGYDEANDPESWTFCEESRWRYASFPAKSPTVIGVGGTMLTQRGGVWGSQVWAQGGSGCSAIFAAPTWQVAVAGWSTTGCGGERLDVDVAANADPHTGPSIYDSTPAPDWPRSGWGVAGGTSAASPIVAAEFALAGGARGVAYPAQTLYTHAGEGSAFEDVEDGSNGSCAGTTVCQGVAGYDGPSGLGSPIGLFAFSLPGAPTNVGLPSISGRAMVGHILTVHDGTWTNGPTWVGYQWEDCNPAGTDCLPIEGATAARYTLRAHDVGRTISVMEVAGNSSGFGPSQFAAATSAVLPRTTDSGVPRRDSRRPS
jgi:hypothetical protein